MDKPRGVPEAQEFGFSRWSLTSSLMNQTVVEGKFWFKYKMTPFRGVITGIGRYKSDPSRFLINGIQEDGEPVFGHVWVVD